MPLQRARARLSSGTAARPTADPALASPWRRSAVPVRVPSRLGDALDPVVVELVEPCRGTQAADMPRAHLGTSDSTATASMLAAIAEQPAEDERLPPHVHAREVLARVGLGVAAAHRRRARRRRSVAPAPTSLSTKPSVPDRHPVDAARPGRPTRCSFREVSMTGSPAPTVASSRSRRPSARAAVSQSDRRRARRPVSGRLLASTTSMPCSSDMPQHAGGVVRPSHPRDRPGSACFAMRAIASSSWTRRRRVPVPAAGPSPCPAQAATGAAA